MRSWPGKFTVVCIVSIVLLVLMTACVQTQSKRTAQHSAETLKKRRQASSYYTGYSKEFQAYRSYLASGKVDKVLASIAEEEKSTYRSSENDEEFARNTGMIDLLERASLTLQAGDIERSLYYCKLAEIVLEDRESESYFSEDLAELGSSFFEAVGAGDYGRYVPAGFEKVMLLNLKAIDYMLLGDERAYNVARLAVEWQDEEKEKFARFMEMVRQKEEADAESMEKKDYVSDEDRKTVYAAIDAEFAKYDNKALDIPNAFVNPFGDYLAGAVNEFKSVKIQSLMSNAHISYKQALSLNPKSRVLKLGVKDTRNNRSAHRLIQVVAFDGFAPEKKVLSMRISVPALTEPLDVEVPTYEPIPSRVHSIKVTATGGRVLTTLSPVADIENLAFRHQKDMLPAVQDAVSTSTLRDAVIRETGNIFILSGFGTLIGALTDSSMEPSTTSWMSLPAKILAGRFHPPRGLKKVKIICYGKKKNKLSEQVVDLADGSRHFIFVRSIDETLAVYPSRKIWSGKKRNQEK